MKISFCSISILLLSSSLAHRGYSAPEELRKNVANKILEQPAITLKLRSITSAPFSQCQALIRQLKRGEKEAATTLAELLIKDSITEIHQKRVIEVLNPNTSIPSDLPPMLTTTPIETEKPPEIILVDYAAELGDSFMADRQRKCQHFEYDPNTGEYFYHNGILQRGGFMDACLKGGLNHRANKACSFTNDLTNIPMDCNKVTETLSQDKNANIEGDLLSRHKICDQDKWAGRLWSIAFCLRAAIANMGIESFPENIDFLSVNIRIRNGYKPTRILNVWKQNGNIQSEIVNNGQYLKIHDDEKSTNLFEVVFSDKEALDNFFAQKKPHVLLKEHKLQFNTTSSTYDENLQKKIINTIKKSVMERDGLTDAMIELHSNENKVKTESYQFRNGTFI